MLQILTGDLFASKAQTLVNTANCLGVMGKGLALEFKLRLPAMFDDYVARCQSKQVRLVWQKALGQDAPRNRAIYRSMVARFGEAENP